MFWISLAAASPLVGCGVSLEGPGGWKQTVKGYGDTELSAAADAESVAWLVADLRASAPWWATAFGWRDGTAVPVPRPGTSSGGLGEVPGYTVEAQGCKPWKAGSSEGWTAALRDESLDRTSPAGAVRGVRRRACFGAYQNAFSVGFEGVANAEADQRASRFATVFEKASDALTKCLSEKPTLTARAPLAVVRKPVVCRTTGLSSRKNHWVSGVGSGPTLTEARDAALWDHLRHRPRFALSEALRFHAEAPPSIVQSMVSQELSELSTLIGPDAGAEQLAMVCTEDREGELTWTSTARECAEGTRTAPSYDPSARHAMCHEDADKGRALVNEALAHASRDQRAALLGKGLSIVYGCQAACEVEAARGGGPVVRGAGEPDYSTMKSALTVLDEALETKNLTTLLGLIPVGMQGALPPSKWFSSFERSLEKDRDGTLRMIDDRAWVLH